MLEHIARAAAANATGNPSADTGAPEASSDPDTAAEKRGAQASGSTSAAQRLNPLRNLADVNSMATHHECVTIMFADIVG